MGDAERRPIHELLKLEPCFSGSGLFWINLGAAVEIICLVDVTGIEPATPCLQIQTTNLAVEENDEKK